MIEEARKVARQVGEKEGIGHSEAAWARVLACEGNLRDAIPAYRDALQTLREVNDRNSFA